MESEFALRYVEVYKEAMKLLGGEPTRRDLLKVGALAATAVAASALPSLAKTQEELAEEISSRQYGIDATNWSRENDGIAIGVSVASNSVYTADQLADYIASALQNGFGDPIANATFTQTREDTGGNAVFFAIAGVPRGPFEVEDVPNQLPGIVKEYREIHSAGLDSLDLTEPS